MKTRSQFLKEVKNLIEKYNYKRALKVACLGIASYPSDPNLYLHRAVIYNQLYQARNALEDLEEFEKITALNKFNVYACVYYEQLGVSRAILFDEDKELFDIKKQEPAEAARNLMLAEQAFECSDQYQLRFRQDVRNLEARACVLMGLEKWSKALDVLNEFAEGGGNISVHYGRAICHKNLKNNGQCLACCVEVLNTPAWRCRSDGLYRRDGVRLIRDDFLDLFQEMLAIAMIASSSTLPKMDLSKVRRGELFRAIKMLPIEKQLAVWHAAADPTTPLGERFHAEHLFVSIFHKNKFMQEIREAQEDAIDTVKLSRKV